MISFKIKSIWRKPTKGEKIVYDQNIWFVIDKLAKINGLSIGDLAKISTILCVANMSLTEFIKCFRDTEIVHL